jgi:sigma-B regulation protein RsbU (phosphoserine phosphatase)
MNSNAPIGSDSDRFDLLYRLSQTFNSSLDLDEVLNRVIDEIITTTQAERGFVMLKDTHGQLIFRVARGIDQMTINDPQFHISLSVAEQVAQDNQAILTSNAQDDERFKDRQSVMILGLRSILCVPLSVKSNLIGVVYVDNSLQSGIFTGEDLELLSAIAVSAAIAIENARLYQVAVDKGRMERELQIAYKVQASLIPDELPQIPGWEFAASWHPAHEVAGDFYDHFQLKQGIIGFIIADVVDKGMPAALFMAYSRSILRASMMNSVSPKEGISIANRLICEDSAYGMFLTLVYIQINIHTGEILYVNAGHNPPLLYKHKDPLDRVQLKPMVRTGMLLGVDEGGVYEQRSVTLDPGDFLMLYTDGVIDAIDSHQREFGVERLESIVLKHRLVSAPDILSNLDACLSAHMAEMAPYDDVTTIVVKKI